MRYTRFRRGAMGRSQRFPAIDQRTLVRRSAVRNLLYETPEELELALPAPSSNGRAWRAAADDVVFEQVAGTYPLAARSGSAAARET